MFDLKKIDVKIKRAKDRESQMKQKRKRLEKTKS